MPLPNPAELDPENNVILAIAELQRQMREIKQAQLLGADNTTIATLEASTTIVVPANSNSGVVYQVTPEFGGLMIIDPTMEVRVDTDDINHKYPIGSSLTAGQNNLSAIIVPDAGVGVDFWTTDDTTGARTFTFQVINFDGSSHTYYIKIKLYGLVNPLIPT